MVAHSNQFVNREISLLYFQERVLAQSLDKSHPLLERLKFICIAANNLDEFFEVRVAGLKEKIHHYRVNYIDATSEQVHQQNHLLIHQHVTKIFIQQDLVLQDHILPELATHDIVFSDAANLDEIQHNWLLEYFSTHILPILTPISVDASRPFPNVPNKSLNFIITFNGADAFDRENQLAILPIPKSLPYFVKLPNSIATHKYHFVFLHSILKLFISELFSGVIIHSCHEFRVTRNSNLLIDEEELVNIKETLKGELQQRKFNEVIRLEVSQECPEGLVQFLANQYELGELDIYKINGNIPNLAPSMKMLDEIDMPELKFPAFIPATPAVFNNYENLFAEIRSQDIMLYHPFDSFVPVIKFIQMAANDVDVLAIRMTIYRTGLDSELVEALIQAATRGKEVHVVLELFARFDEEVNLYWAKELEQVGVKVVYGVVGYKTHAKMLSVLRRESVLEKTAKDEIKCVNKLVYYTHLGTGNYNAKTAKLYTDMSLFTANQDIGVEVRNIFWHLSGHGAAPQLHYLLQAPFSLFSQLKLKIDGEIAAAKKGKKALIIAKMNSLLSEEMIMELYAASNAGVKIELIVRGACALRPGIKGLSENITVRSIVGRFLEHTRIFYFYADGAEDTYLSSADWMNRNLFRRIEIAFPILDKKVKRQVIKQGLKMYLLDNKNAWLLNGETGIYHRRQIRTKLNDVHINLMRE